MSPEPVYYVKQTNIPKTWQRFAFGFVGISIALCTGLYMQDIALKRFAKFRGRTALYGDSTLNGGRQI